MTTTKKRQNLRNALSQEECLFPGSVYDPISARIAEDLGYEAGMFAGSIASMTVLGAPDLIVLSLTEFADQARRICRAGNLPLIVDADHGYGNALNVKRTVEELENAGVAALSIEDTQLPVAFGENNSRLTSIQEGAGKMRAALAGRQDPSLIIIGRTSAPKVTTLEDAVARAKAYQDAGVDMLMFVGVKTRDHLDAIADAVSLPIMLGGAGPDVKNDARYLASRGVRVCLRGHQPFMAAVKATYDTLKALREGLSPSSLENIADPDLMNTVTRDDDYRNNLVQFLTAGNKE